MAKKQVAPVPGVTVEEARLKWCHRIPSRMAGNSEDVVQFRERTCCIGHDCMAWRWVGRTVRGYCGLAGKDGV